MFIFNDFSDILFSETLLLEKYMALEVIVFDSQNWNSMKTTLYDESHENA